MDLGFQQDHCQKAKIDTQQIDLTQYLTLLMSPISYYVNTLQQALHSDATSNSI